MERNDKVLVRITKSGAKYKSSLKAGQFRTAKLGSTSVGLAYVNLSDGDSKFVLLATNLHTSSNSECIILRRIK
jgi:hypothetical protein